MGEIHKSRDRYTTQHTHKNMTGSKIGGKVDKSPRSKLHKSKY